VFSQILHNCEREIIGFENSLAFDLIISPFRVRNFSLKRFLLKLSFRNLKHNNVCHTYDLRHVILLISSLKLPVN
jgi:hypothetical protein